MINVVSSNLNTTQTLPADYGWSVVMDMLQGDVKLLQGQPEVEDAVEAQFEQILKALKPYVKLAGGNTMTAFQDLKTALIDYNQNPSLGNSKLEAALNELRSNPPQLTPLNFQKATSQLIDKLHGFVEKADMDNSSTAMLVLNYITTYSNQLLPAGFRDLFNEVISAYNIFAQSRVTGGPGPTQAEIEALLTKLQDLKAVLPAF
ncbi:MAG: hypothetical protein JSS32_10635 [Verrucomicrobia bacterium]|nr:hypothetical protein [Verrucomicrobiota bacterium]